MSVLRFTPASEGGSREVALSPVTTLLVALLKAGAPIRHDCGGRALCGTCRLALDEPSAVSRMGTLERTRLEALGLTTDGAIRLACQATAKRDLSASALVPKDGAAGQKA